MKCVRAAVLAVALLSAATAAQANTLLFEFDQVISGDTPDGASPWLTATIADVTGSQPGVLVTLAASGLGGSDFITEWNFNTTLPSLDGLQHTYSTVTGTTNLTHFFSGIDSVNAGTGAWFDLGLRFTTAGNQGGTNRFMGGELATLFLYGIADLNAETFLALSSPAAKAYLAEAKIQGIGGDAEASSWIVPETETTPVPEPGTMMLLGTGVLGLALYGKRRRNG